MNVEKVANLLLQVLDGKEISYDELHSATWTADGKLDEIARKAWLALQEWRADRDIRDSEPEYADARREKLQELLEQLQQAAKET